ncbi:MAG: pseudaminic acid cytidylyltransferase [Bacteroidia bacterium 43-41]|nr:MAG: pseudaminic acid cytidylyltransferase [Bacteroidia bacterium 43-41]
MKNLAIIPARGGSKRIPKKNIRDFLGKPIIAYSIEAAIKSNLFDEIMVSTDDNEIAETAKKYGASVPFMRSTKTADDTSGLADVIEDVKKMYALKNIEFENICCILATSPLTSKEILQVGLTELISKNADSVRPVVRFPYPIQRSLKMDSDGGVSFFHPEFAQTRSQDLETAFHDAGMFYWMKADKGLKGNNRFGFEISEMECQDIDNETDWKMAELKFKLQKR